MSGSGKVAQGQAILRALQSGARLTAVDALHMFGCARLAARIHDLRRAGHVVHTEMVKVPARGGGTARVAVYFMPVPRQMEFPWESSR